MSYLKKRPEVPAFKRFASKRRGKGPKNHDSASHHHNTKYWTKLMNIKEIVGIQEAVANSKVFYLIPQPAVEKSNLKNKSNENPLENVIMNQEDAKRISDCVIEIEKKINQILPHQRGHSIFQVPRRIQKLQPDAFTPQIVSIGPYHRDKEHLQEMEYHKWRLLGHVLRRTGFPLDYFLAIMYQLEADAKNCYENIDKHTAKFHPGEFMEMMLLDACFILEQFNASANGFKNCGYSLDDPLFSSRGMSPFIKRDLLMLENQLPLFVLDRLLPLIGDQSYINSSVTELAVNFFDSVIPGISKNPPMISRNRLGRFHLLAVVRHSLQPYSSFQRFASNLVEKPLPQIVMHSVTRLRGTSIIFKKRKDSTKFTDIKLNKRVLLIPQIVIHDSTKSVFLNLMAFEQCYPHCSNYITSYISFMDGLINDSKDVDYLCKQGIIVHEFGSEEDVADLFNNLRREIFLDTTDYYLAKISEDLDKHFNRKWLTWTATLMHEYFKNPWKIISFAAGCFLILIALTQTVYGLLSFHINDS